MKPTRSFRDAWPRRGNHAPGVGAEPRKAETLATKGRSPEVAIRAVGLCKLYRIGEAQEKYKTLRDTLAGIVAAPLRRLRLAGKLRSRADRTIWALRDVSFEVPRGEVVGVIGRNGAGKSTLLKVLSRITEPTEGRAEIHGRVGSLLDVGTGFHNELTGRENVFLNGAILGMRRAEIEAKFDEIVAFAEIEKFIDTTVKHYSTGMYMRLAFSVEAHLEPDILLVDEVLAVGDVAFQRRCIGKLREVGLAGRTVLFVSHNLAAIANLCTRAILIANGRIAGDASPEAAIALYLAQHAGVVYQLAERQDRTGTGRLKFIDLTVRDGDGANLPVAAAGGEVWFALEYAASDARPLTNVLTEIKVGDQFGSLLLTLSTYLLNRPFPALPGRGAVYCHVRELLLAPGVYDLTLICIVNGELADQIEIRGGLTVGGGDYYQSGRLPKQKVHGPMLVPHAWHAEESARGMLGDSPDMAARIPPDARPKNKPQLDHPFENGRK